MIIIIIISTKERKKNINNKKFHFFVCQSDTGRKNNREGTKENAKEVGPIENVTSSGISVGGPRIDVESNTEAPSGWSSARSGSLKKTNESSYDANAVLEKVALFHKHRHARGRDATTGSLHRTLSLHTTAIEQTYMAEECDENDYHLDLDSYKPVQPILIDHGVALFPVAAPHTGMDLHILQVNFTYIFQLIPNGHV